MRVVQQDCRELGIAFVRLRTIRLQFSFTRCYTPIGGIMALYCWFRRAGILVSVGAVVLTCGCRQAREQPEAGSQAIEGAPQIGEVSPMSGTGRSQAFRVVVSHPAGATAIGDLQVLIAEKMTPTGSGAC